VHVDEREQGSLSSEGTVGYIVLVPRYVG
jgi:hypothetical protein